MRRAVKSSFRLFAVWLMISLAQAQEASPTEYQLKAAFLFNFVKYVDWPAESFAGPEAPFVIGVLGENPFGRELENTLRNKTIGGRPLVQKLVATVEDAKGCHVLFISTSESKRFREIFTRLQSTSTLTVGETEKFLDAGGMINFVIEGKKLRFQINAEAAKNAGLRISSKLLSLAVPASK